MEENKKNEKNKQCKVLMEGQKEDPDKYLDTFPPGYRFCPTDRELIIHYLKPKNLNQSIPISCIKTATVYEKTPQELTEIFKLRREKKWYFFTQLNPSFRSRKAGNGYWKTDRPEEPIDIDDQVVGYKRCLVFEEGSPRIKTDWRMKEYRYRKESDLQRSSTANVQGDWILCKMHTAEYDKDNLQQEGGTMSTRVPAGVPNTGPKMQNEDPLQLTLGPPDGVPNTGPKMQNEDPLQLTLGPPDGVPNTGPKMQNEDPLQLTLEPPDGVPNTGSKMQNEDPLQLTLGPPDGVPKTRPKMQNEDSLQLTLGTRSSGLQSNSSKISAIEEQNSYWDSIPPGYRFCPTDEELIVHYLKPKRLSKYLPDNRIRDVNLYDYHPRDLTEKFEPVQINEWYFFTKTKLKFRHGKIKEREAGNGHWKEGKELPINSNGRRIGSNRSFTFYEDELDQSSTLTNWIMNEYELDQESAPTSMGHQEKELNDFVLCIMHNSQEAKQAKKKRKRIEGTETADAKEEPNKTPMKLL